MSALPPTVWRETSEISPIAPGEIHVWRINLARPPAETARLKNILSAAEKKSAARFHFAHDQRRFVVRRAVLRQLLAAQLGLRPEEIKIDSAHFQKPKIIAAQNPRRLQFSSSHSGDWALIALAQNCEVGVDVEQCRPLPDAADFVKNYFSDWEIAEFARLSAPARTEGFFNCWTRKEAFVKALGLGFAYPLKQFSVTLAPGQPAALVEVAGDANAREKWRMVSLDVAPACAAALVFEAGLSAVRYFDWRW
jgi:4'-phosphopantetheinyl transferase